MRTPRQRAKHCYRRLCQLSPPMTTDNDERARLIIEDEMTKLLREAIEAARPFVTDHEGFKQEITRPMTDRMRTLAENKKQAISDGDWK